VHGYRGPVRHHCGQLHRALIGSARWAAAATIRCRSPCGCRPNSPCGLDATQRNPPRFEHSGRLLRGRRRDLQAHLQLDDHPAAARRARAEGEGKHAPLLARCLGLAVLKLRDGWAPFERERPSPWPYNHAERGIWSSAMMLGLTILAVLTFVAIGEVRRTQGKQLKNED
jgi:hypothetical protein